MRDRQLHGCEPRSVNAGMITRCVLHTIRSSALALKQLIDRDTALISAVGCSQGTLLLWTVPNVFTMNRS